jgi:phosphoglycolate phosphatase
VHEVDVMNVDAVKYAGRTDAAITRDLLSAVGVEGAAIDARWEAVKTAAAEAYGRLCPPDLSACVAPGMVELLDELAARLPAIARARASDPPWERSRTVVIGDTPHDIACARVDEVRVAAVATGPFAITQLAAADAVVDDARALLPVLEDWV